MQYKRWIITCGIILCTWYQVAYADIVSPTQDEAGKQYAKAVLNKIQEQWIATLIPNNNNLVPPVTLHVHFFLTHDRHVQGIDITPGKPTDLIVQLTRKALMQTEYPPFPEGVHTVNDSLEFNVNFVMH